MIRLKRLVQIALPIAAIGFAVYFLRFAPVAAVSCEVAEQRVVEEVLGTGTLEARVSATISSKISGRVREMLVDQGDRVERDQRLVTLEDEELRGLVSIAEANLDAAKAGLERLKEDKKRAEVIADQAQRTYDRVEQLKRQNAVSQEEFDKSSEALALGSAGVSLTEAAINEGQTKLVAAEKELEYQRARLADALIHAPFDGMVVRRYREAGDVVVPGSQILSVISLDELWISAWVDETAISRLAVDQPARVVFRSDSDRSFPGRVARLGREADRETREFIVDVEVLERPQNWAVGQRAEVYIQTASNPGCLVIPVEFLRRRDGRDSVQLLEGQRPVWRDVETGLRGRDLVEIVGGLSRGDVVLRSAEPGASVPEERPVKIQ